MNSSATVLQVGTIKGKCALLALPAFEGEQVVLVELLDIAAAETILLDLEDGTVKHERRQVLDGILDRFGARLEAVEVQRRRLSRTLRIIQLGRNCVIENWHPPYVHLAERECQETRLQ